MSKPLIPVAGPWITEREAKYAEDAARTAWYEHHGDFIRRFEAEMCHVTGRKFAISLPHCTAGLHLALAALGIGPGDDVIVPDATWIASAAPITYVGATPVFADVEPETWCLSARTIGAALTDATKAVICVDLYGAMPDYADVESLCQARGIALVEDAAESLGSALTSAGSRRRPAGSFGAFSTFSFHGSKTVTTGEGGMIVTDDESAYQRMMLLRDHGRDPDPMRARLFMNVEVGFKYKMSALQAAVGLAQIERLHELVARKVSIFQHYRSRLADQPSVLALNPERAGLENSYWMSTAILDPATGFTTPALMDALRAEGIDSRPFFAPLSSLEAYRDARDRRRAAEANTAAYSLARLALNLPSALNLTADQIDYVCDRLLALLGAG